VPVSKKNITALAAWIQCDIAKFTWEKGIIENQGKPTRKTDYN
jgi:hypothetical protein